MQYPPLHFHLHTAIIAAIFLYKAGKVLCLGQLKYFCTKKHNRVLREYVLKFRRLFIYSSIGMR